MREIRLNAEQQAAVEHGEGPLLVIAGPGSGKTSVATRRIVHLLESVAGLQPENILALTYTEKAAGEMKRRVSEALPGLASAPHVSTFHAFCYHVLRARHFDRRLLDQVDVWIFLRQRMEELQLEYYRKLAEPGAFLHGLNEFFSRCQDELIEPSDFERFVQSAEKKFVESAASLDPAEGKLRAEEVGKQKELARVFRKSRELIQAAGSSTFGSLLSETVRLWKEEKEALRKYQEQFQYILVDEFQDTNFAQVELLRCLVARPFNITAVGDDDQAIYRFRGASHGAFQMFGKVFPGYQTVYLRMNHRSTKRILRCAEVVIAQNDHEIKKPALQTEKGEGNNVWVVQSPDDASEAAWIADEIQRLASRGTAYEDVAVLYRAHNYRDLLVKELRRKKIPFDIRGLSLLSTALLRGLLAYLNLVHSPHHNVSLTRALLAPRWKFPEGLALEIRKQARKRSLFAALEAMEQSLFKQELESTGWPDLKKLIRGLNQKALGASMTVLLDLLVSQLGLVYLPGDSEQAYLNAFRKFLADWEEKSETRKLREFMEYFQYFVEAGGRIEVPEAARPPNAVQMMTVHAAKGLEFPVVFILGVAPQRFPHRQQKPAIEFPDELGRGPEPPANIHEQEERRLFFVAMTRAKEKLYVSSVAQPGKKLSKFVDDLFSDPVVRARDIEQIQVAEIPEGARQASPFPTERPATRQERAGLFGRIRTPQDALHPDLAAWASRPPALAPDEKLQLSATVIEEYSSCPLKFKFRHFLKVPTGPQGALTFGNVMHSCVRHYFELRKKGLPRFEDLERFYRESWKGAGFEDTYQEEAYKKAGLDQLRRFVEQQKDSAIPPDKIRLEEYFSLDLGDVVLQGRIDQIHPLGPARPGDDRAVELIDYKTGRPRSQKDADQSLQLSVYALAARDQLMLKPGRLTFYHLTNNQTVSTVRTEKDLDRAVEEIREVATQIRRLCFDPTPGYVCKRCDFVSICPAHEEDF